MYHFEEFEHGDLCVVLRLLVGTRTSHFVCLMSFKCPPQTHFRDKVVRKSGLTRFNHGMHLE